MIKCKKCLNEKNVQEHHLIPKFTYDNFKEINYKEGKVWLCEKCHNILHSITAKIIFDCIKENNKDKCRKKIKEFTLRWMNLK